MRLGKKTYTRETLQEPFFEPHSQKFWKIYSWLMIPLNILIMLYMFKVVVINIDGISPIRDWQRGLWLSQYLGLVCAYLVLTDFKSPILNGFYLYTFIFPHLAFYGSFGDPFSFSNHFAHFLGWYMMFNPKFKIDRKGIYWGFGFILVWLILCFVLQYPDGMGANANNISDEKFPVMIVGGIIWLLIVDRMWVRKQQQIFKILNVPDEEWLWEQDAKHWIPRIIKHPLDEIPPRNPRYLLAGILILFYFVMLWILAGIQTNSFSYLWVSYWMGLIGIVGLIQSFRNAFINEMFFVFLPFGIIFSIGNSFSNLIHLQILILNLLVTFFYLKQLKTEGFRRTLGIDNIGIVVGFYLFGILMLLSGNLAYNQNTMLLNGNLMETILPLIFILLAVGWIHYLFQQKPTYLESKPFLH